MDTYGPLPLVVLVSRGLAKTAICESDVNWKRENEQRPEWENLFSQMIYDSAPSVHPFAPRRLHLHWNFVGSFGWLNLFDYGSDRKTLSGGRTHKARNMVPNTQKIGGLVLVPSSRSIPEFQHHIPSQKNSDPKNKPINPFRESI